MDNNKLFPFLRSSFNPLDIYKSIRNFEGFRTWNIVKHEPIGDRGLILHIKSDSFVGCVLIVVENDMFVFRKINKCGFVLLVNKTKYISTFGIILDNYLVE